MGCAWKEGSDNCVGISIGAVRVGHVPALLLPRRVTGDAERQVAFVTDDVYDAAIAVDLRTGDRELML